MRKLAIVLALTAFSGAAWGQAGDFWFNYGESFFNNANLGTPLAFGGSSNDITLGSPDYRFGFRYSFNLKDHLGAEIGYAFNHTSLNYDAAAVAGLGGTGTANLSMHMHQVMFNGMYYPFTPDKARVRPFVVAGFGFDNFVPPGGSSFGGSTKIAGDFGAGVKVHIGHMLGLPVGIRFDVREYISGQPNFGFLMGGGGLWQTEASAGIGVGF
jgi:hypothetical protein